MVYGHHDVLSGGHTLGYSSIASLRNAAHTLQVSSHDGQMHAAISPQRRHRITHLEDDFHVGDGLEPATATHEDHIGDHSVRPCEVGLSQWSANFLLLVWLEWLRHLPTALFASHQPFTITISITQTSVSPRAISPPLDVFPAQRGVDEGGQGLGSAFALLDCRRQWPGSEGCVQRQDVRVEIQQLALG